MAEINNGYTQAQIVAMQKDAMRRVNEMQRISRERLNGTQSNTPHAEQVHTEHTEHTEHTGHAEPKPQEPLHQSHAQQPQQGSSPQSKQTVMTNGVNPIKPIKPIETEIVPSGFKGILEKLDLNEEKIIIMLLLLLLVNEGADIKLILALVYILL